MKWIHCCLSTGVVTSPNYPCDYLNKLNRTTTITAKEGMVVELEFTAFNTYSGSDTLTILDNDGTVLSQERSGDCLPPKMWSRTNVVHLQFVTSYYGTRTGWSANWASVAPTGYHSNSTQMMIKIQKEGNFSFLCPLHFQLHLKGGKTENNWDFATARNMGRGQRERKRELHVATCLWALWDKVLRLWWAFQSLL